MGRPASSVPSEPILDLTYRYELPWLAEQLADRFPERSKAAWLKILERLKDQTRVSIGVADAICTILETHLGEVLGEWDDRPGHWYLTQEEAAGIESEVTDWVREALVRQPEWSQDELLEHLRRAIPPGTYPPDPEYFLEYGRVAWCKLQAERQR